MPMSPSSRRAWIEIGYRSRLAFFAVVALLAEGVDRNNELDEAIEDYHVALLAEGVDRNFVPSRLLWEHFGRPPRGGRG